MLNKVSLSFQNYTDANLLTEAESIRLSISKSPFFPNIVPTLADFTLTVEKYSQALILAKGLGKYNVADKNVSRDLLQESLVTLGLSVMIAAQGNPAIIAASGYKPITARSGRSLGIATALTLTTGGNGEVIVTFKAIENAVSYMYEISADPLLAEASWSRVFGTTAKYTFTNLEAGKKYSVRVMAVGSANQTVYTPVASIYAQ